MMRALAWKELREHRLVWLAMLSLALMSVLGLPVALKPEGMDALPPTELRIVIACAVIIAGVSGLVCGAMMLAGEREQGTMAFLDSLTGRRGGVWLRKLVLGIGFVLVLGLIAGAAAMAMGLEGSGWPRRIWLLALPLVAVQAYLWGLVGSALCRSVMPAIGIGALLWGIFGAFFMALLLKPGGARVSGAFLLAIFSVLALILSATAFCRNDLTRHRATARARPVLGAIPGGSGFRALAWLLYRQARWELLVLSVVAFVIGLFLSADLVGIWVLGTLLLGLLCGSGVFAGEQRGGYARFLGDQRLPAGRVWLAKIVAYAGMALLLCLFMSIGTVISLARSGHLVALEASGVGTLTGSLIRVMGLWPALVLWLAYGFAFGQLFSMLFRKGIVAVVLAGVAAICLVGLWIPSVLLGGVHSWQVFGLPLLVIVSSRLLAWAWLTDGLRAWRPALVLTTCLAIGLIWTGGGIAYRVAEVRNVGEPFDLAAYEASMPKPEQNRAGELIARALRTIVQAEKEAAEALGPISPWPPEGMEVPEGTGPEFSALVRMAPEQGLRFVPKFGAWLDRVFESEPINQLTEAASLPLGVVLSPRQMELGRTSAIDEQLNGLRKIQWLFVARALQLQARGEGTAELDHIVWMLKLSRHMRHRSPYLMWLHGVAMQREALIALERLAGSGRATPALLRRGLVELQAHEQQIPPPVECLQTEYLLARARLKQPLAAFERNFAVGRQWGAPGDGHFQLLVLGFSVPWEHERARRLLDEVFDGRFRGLQRGYPAADWFEVATCSYAWGMLRGWVPPEGADLKHEQDRLRELLEASWLTLFPEHVVATPLFPATLSRCRLAAAQLQLALVLHQLETGQPAERLDDLVPKYLAALPLDPFSRRPFGYRISVGETLSWLPNPLRLHLDAERVIPAGDGILWSTGPDGIDHGGVTQGIYTEEQHMGPVMGPFLDFLFLVPNLKRGSP